MITNNENNIQLLKERLLNSNWPKCDEIAEEILSIKGNGVKEVLIEALKNGKRHHVRTAAIRALVKLNDKSVVQHIELLLNDPSYDARIQAKIAIKELTGQDVLTAKGE